MNEKLGHLVRLDRTHRVTVNVGHGAIQIRVRARVEVGETKPACKQTDNKRRRSSDARNDITRISSEGIPRTARRNDTNPSK